MAVGLVWTVVVLVGVAGGVVLSGPAAEWAALAVAAASIALAVDAPRARRMAVLVALLGAAGADGALARDRSRAAPLDRWFRTLAPDDRSPDVVMVQGTLAADATLADNGVRLLIDVESLRAGGAWSVIPGRLQAHVSGALAAGAMTAWTSGRAVAAPVMLRRPQTWRNPGSAGGEWQQLRRTVDLVGTIKSASLVSVEPGRWWDEAAARLRHRVRDAARRYVAPRSAQSAAIVAAILIGDRAGLADDVQRRLQAAGTYHVIAISGGNVAILTWLCVVLLRTVVRSFRAVAIITMAAVVSYGWVVGAEPSVRRAVTAACIYLGLSVIGLMPRALDVLGVTAMIVVLVDPLTVVDTGAWLSFGATLGIIVGAGRFMRWATEFGRAPAGRARAISLVRRVWLAVLGLFSATLAAELALVPVSAAVFSRVSALGLVLNFVAIPAMTVVQISGLIAVGLAGWWDRGADLAGRVADLAATGLVGSAAAVDAAPWLVWRVPPTSICWLLAYYAGAATFLWRRDRSRWRILGAVGTGVCLVVIVLAPGVELAAPPATRLRVTMLDVGQGDSILVQFPSGQSLLIDAGGAAGPFDIGGRVVTPALWALGVRRLDWLAVTHADQDHIGGALSVTRDLRPREIWEGVPVPRNPELRALRALAHLDHIVWRQVLSGHHVEIGSVVLDVLHPPAPDWERQRVRNDDSLVLRLRCGEVEIMLTGDAGREFESHMSAEASPLPLRLLKIGHHGSLSSSSAPFVDAIRPQIAFVSAGRGNLFGHPVPQVLARYAHAGTIVFRTDQDGAIVIETDGGDVDIRTMSGRHWQLSVRRGP